MNFIRKVVKLIRHLQGFTIKMLTDRQNLKIRFPPYKFTKKASVCQTYPLHFEKRFCVWKASIYLSSYFFCSSPQGDEGTKDCITGHDYENCHEPRVSQWQRPVAFLHTHTYAFVNAAGYPQVFCRRGSERERYEKINEWDNERDRERKRVRSKNVRKKSVDWVGRSEMSRWGRCEGKQKRERSSKWRNTT